MKTVMTHSKTATQLTVSFEGCVLKAYRDNGGVWTIAYGHTRGVKEGDVCTLFQAEKWLDEDYADAETCVNKLVSVELTQPEFDALVDFVFNVGGSKFAGSTMLKLINQSKFLSAADEFLKWKFVKGTICAGILRRRIAERELFDSGLTHG